MHTGIKFLTISAILLISFTNQINQVDGFKIYRGIADKNIISYDLKATATVGSTCPCVLLNTSQCQVTCSDCSRKCDLNNVRNRLVTQLSVIRGSITSSSPIYTEVNNEQQYLSTVVAMPQSVTNYYICACTDTNLYPCNDVCNGCLKTTNGRCLIGQVCDHVKATVTSIRGLLPSRNSSQEVTNLYDNVDRFAAICAGSHIFPNLILVAVLVLMAISLNH